MPANRLYSRHRLYLLMILAVCIGSLLTFFDKSQSRDVVFAWILIAALFGFLSQQD